MRRVALLALGLMFAGIWPHDGARGQTSAPPPVSLAPPDASPPRAGAKNSRLPPATAGRASTSVIGEPAPAPNPAADYDGFSAVDDNDTPSQVTPPVRSRAAKGGKSNPDANSSADPSSIDQEDEALKRKLTICKNCK
ncbi:hypothetical protein I3J27_11935 [Bradyrhizobium xenonodulans]|uniref:Uncharacterized protein n=1 Tax=Bradyrhizobium xenonodulans TaxID=2736875 RepID=A0ABY7MTY0_9BRAD|nr:hypothetical protein [Bradyrhizobium xenonodulans]WBL81086.1 hypothetical protein I3J27_11935 [Bradyrhizobium xenonodulans]